MEDDDNAKLMDYWAGYSWGMNLGEQWGWCKGIVVTPKWIDKAVQDAWTKARGRDFEWMLDNGAWSAYVSGKPLSFKAQMNGILAALYRIEPRWIIAPDIVAEPELSWLRTQASLPYLSDYVRQGKVLFALQDGSNTEEIVSAALRCGCGVFIGGSTKKWKLEELARVRSISSNVYIHIGRIAKADELRDASLGGADSFDTTTFVRKQKNNTSIDFEERFEGYVRKQSG